MHDKHALELKQLRSLLRQLVGVAPSNPMRARHVELYEQQVQTHEAQIAEHEAAIARHRASIEVAQRMLHLAADNNARLDLVEATEAEMKTVRVESTREERERLVRIAREELHHLKQLLTETEGDE